MGSRQNRSMISWDVLTWLPGAGEAEQDPKPIIRWPTATGTVKDSREPIRGREDQFLLPINSIL
jgi:hypothetical protein